MPIGKVITEASAKAGMLAVPYYAYRFAMIANELLTESTKLLYDRGLQYGKSGERAISGHIALTDFDNDLDAF
jgi:hypothetical protein